MGGLTPLLRVPQSGQGVGGTSSTMVTRVSLDNSPHFLLKAGGSGISDLIQTIRRSIFPIEAQEAKVLFQAGQKPFGPMSRQQSETVEGARRAPEG